MRKFAWVDCKLLLLLIAILFVTLLYTIAEASGTFNTLNDYENGLCVFKAMMSEREEEEKVSTFNGDAVIVPISGHPRGVKKAADFNVVGDYLLYPSSIVAKSVCFWINLKSSTENIIDPVSGNDIDAVSGQLAYTDWDNAYVNAVDGDSIEVGWQFVVITSTTNVDWSSGINVGKGALQLCHLRFWNYALSPTEVSQLYYGTVGDYSENCVGHWDFPDLKDQSGNGNRGAGVDVSVVVSGRNQGSCFYFDGANDYVDFGNPSALQLGDTEQTIAVWLSLSSIAASYMYSSRDGTKGELSFSMDNLGRPQAWIGTTDNTASPTNLPVGVWKHAVLTYGDAGLLYYLDGVSIGADTTPTGSWDTTADKYVGLRGGLAGDFDGLIDQVSIFNSALTQLQVNQLYNRTKRGSF